MKLLIYRAILIPIYLLAAPFLLLFLFKKKYRRSIPARFFCIQKSPSQDREIWFHACSFGEVKSLIPIIKALKREKILLTTTTQTGHKLATQSFSHDVEIRYLPFELFISLWKMPSLQTLIVLEAEMWLNLFAHAKQLGAQTWLINARISDRSYKKYLRFRFYYQSVFQYTDAILAQSQNDVIRLKSLGAQHAEDFGNLKIYAPIKPARLYPKPKKLLITAASTHQEEEKIILSAFLEFRAKEPDCMLIIAPRHPERFNDVYAMLQDLKAGRISEAGIDESRDILLLDLLGDLNSIYRISDIAILCGSFVKAGGHNPLEPAFFGTKLISGPYIFNQYALFDHIENYYIAHNLEELKSILACHHDLQPAKIKDQGQSLESLLTKIFPNSFHRGRNG